MKLSSTILVAGRYQLVECLGAGAMGEVWRAQDTRFDTRTVAVKFLREDETIKEDQLNRDRLLIRLEQHASRGTLNFEAALSAAVAALGTSNPEGVRAKLTAGLNATAAIRPSDVVGVFDELVNDPTLNDNARMRAKLRRLFRDEANAVANLRHDNIVSIFDYGDHEGSPYLVMDYIAGRTLYQVIQDRQRLPHSRRLQFIEDLCAGLGYAHRHKLVHRDIKPANLIIDASTGSLKILDFGVVRRLGSASTVGVPVGTFCYMSPEQTKGAATLDHRSDIFAVGLVFYELMVGKKAFPPGKSIGDLVARIQRDPPPDMLELDPTVPKAVRAIIDKAIQKLPDERYPDLTIMGKEIGRLRMKLLAEEQTLNTSFTVSDEQKTILKPRQTGPSPADLLASAQRAFESGDVSTANELARRVLELRPDDTAAEDLLRRVEARQIEARVRDALQPAEKFLALEEITSARAAVAAAESIAPSSPLIAAFRARLDLAAAARQSTRERLQQDREAREQEQRAQQERAREQERLEREQLLREERARERARLEREHRAREERDREQARLAAELRQREEQERLAREQKAREEQERQEHERQERERQEHERQERERQERERHEREQREREEQAREQERLAREQKAREERERQEREQRERDERAREQERLLREQKAREERERLEREQREQRERAQQERERQQKEAELRQQRLRDLARVEGPAEAGVSDVTMKLSRDALGPPLTTPPALTKSKTQTQPATPAPRTAGPARTTAPPPSVSAPPAPAAGPAVPPKTVGPTRKSRRYTVRPTAPPPAPAVGPAPPVVPPVTTGKPSPVPVPSQMSAQRAGVSPQTIGIALAVIAFLLLAIAIFLWVQSRSAGTPAQPAASASTPPESTTTPAPAPPSTPVESPPAESTSPETVAEPATTDPPAPALMSTVYIDLRPWARVKIVPATPDAAIPTDTFFAPFAIDLPAGVYNLEAENGGVTRATTFQLKVAEGGPQTFVRNMPGFNATKIVEGLLSQD